jgi:hypothetical protein
MWASEMERRDREAARPEGYRDAACEACGCGLYVPVGQGGDVLCPHCEREGEALAAAEDSVVDDDDPRPPAGGALHPDYPYFAALAARMLDDQLSEAIGIAESEPATFQLANLGQREAFIASMAAEVVRRLEGRRAAVGRVSALARPVRLAEVQAMTKQQIEVLRNEVESMAAAGAGRGEFREWAEAYYFGIEDLYEVVKLMVDELEGYRQRADEERSPRSN